MIHVFSEIFVDKCRVSVGIIDLLFGKIRIILCASWILQFLKKQSKV